MLSLGYCPSARGHSSGCHPTNIISHSLSFCLPVRAQEMLGIPLLGAIPEDTNVIISTNKGVSWQESNHSSDMRPWHSMT